MTTVLRVSGRALEASRLNASPLRSKFHTRHDERGVDVGAVREAGVGEVRLEDRQDSDLVELQLADGAVLVMSVDRLQELIRAGASLRGGDPTLVPEYLPLGVADRGVGTVVLKILRVFRADPVDAIASLATRDAVARIEGQLAAEPGLYRLDARGRLDAPEAAWGSTDVPSLVFIHGTASTTQGSFGKLFADTREWRDLRTRYGDQIFALEHRTLSESPAQNALALVRGLAPRAEVHLVTHSRGGLVGELLCRGGFGSEDIRVFTRHRDRPAEERDCLLELGQELQRRAPRVERFVRVGCPAAGTVLASDRLDLYLSLIFNALQFAAPEGADVLIEFLSAVLLEVARRRAQPAELPGLEAQRPESPFVHFLNRGDVPAVDHDLSVIAGDLQAGNLLQTLRAVAAYTFFLEKNDLVVDTKAMYGGLRRASASGGWVSFHEGPRVTHLTYFSESATRERLAAALLRARRDESPPGFLALKRDREERSFAFWRGAENGDRAPGPGGGLVLVVPDIFATELHGPTDRVWADAGTIASGALGDLLASRDAKVGPLVEEDRQLTRLRRTLATSRVQAVPYDWRGGIAQAAHALQKALHESLKHDGHVGVVAHGLGALAVLEVVRRQSREWSELRTRGGRAVLLAPPLDGAAAILRLATGRGPLFRILQMLDAPPSPDDLVKPLIALTGVVDLLPEYALDAQWWRRFTDGVPDDTALKDARQRRADLRPALADPGLVVVFGAADLTITLDRNADGDFAAGRSRAGDGWMVNPVEGVPAGRRWFVPALHEALLSDPTAVRVVSDLLRGNWTSAGSREAPDPAAIRREVEPVRFPGQDDLEATLLFGGEPPAAATRELRVRVAHGSLDRLGWPVAVGHYDADAIYGAEKFLDRCLKGSLSRRREAGLGLYPGPAGTALYVPAPDCLPRGALVVGLGNVGELTTDTLTRGVAAAALNYALHELDARAASSGAGAPLSLTLASLLIGTRGGREISVRRSVAAIANGVLLANRVLAERFPGAVQIEELWFVELWADIAIQAGRAVAALKDDPALDLLPAEAIEARGRLAILEGARGNSRETADWSWWRRLIISHQPGAAGAPDGLHFTALTERARAEDRFVFTMGQPLEDLLTQAPAGSSQVTGLALANALYELLLPVSIKEGLYDGTEMVLVVDQESGRYPWELLARRRGDEIEPLVRRVRVIRQFRTSRFRETLIAAQTRQALVVGNPSGSNPSLEGAELECDEVHALLERHGYTVQFSKRETGADIVQKLFLNDYRIMHIAAHGEYRPNDPAHSGVLIGPAQGGNPRVLTAAVFKQLRTVPDLVFLNCCHLGRLDVPGQAGRLAASVAESLIDLGVRAVVVAGWAVHDFAARAFAQSFYAVLLAGRPFGEAVHAGRRAVWRDHPESTTWGAYQCYGDPTFTLSPPRPTDGERAIPFVSAAEAQGEHEDVDAATSTFGDDAVERTRYRARLDNLEGLLDGGWVRHGALLSARAKAWSDLGDTVRAIDLYHDALQAGDSRAPVLAVEQLANLLDRLGREVARAETNPAADGRAELFEAARRLLDRLWPPSWPAAETGKSSLVERCARLAEWWLDKADGLGRTPERHGLRGGWLKRAAEGAQNPAQRRALLRRAAQQYEDGVRLAEAQTGRIPVYPGIPAVTVRWAIGALSPGDTEKLRTWLQGCRLSAATEEREVGKTFWNMVSLIEADVLEALLTASAFTLQHADQLAARYRACLDAYGTERERDSVLRALSFLKESASARRRPRAPSTARSPEHTLTTGAFLARIEEGVRHRQEAR